MIIGSRTVLKTVGRDERLGGSSPSASAIYYMVSIVQLVRMSDCGSEGRRIVPD